MTFETNFFSLSYYEQILCSARAQGYVVMTMEDYWAHGCPDKNCFVLRHDVDSKPHTLKKMLDVERKCGCRSTLYVRICGAPYNFLDYPVYRILKDAEDDGFRIGLHTNYVEFATINKLDPIDVLVSETAALRSFFPSVRSLAPHRDHNYVVNSLPHLEANWKTIVERTGCYLFQAYDREIAEPSEYVNEGYELHLRWRNRKPEDVIPTSKSIVMMTHSHWWYRDHPFEE